MWQQQLKNELLYQQVIEGNAENIKALYNDGADVEVYKFAPMYPILLKILAFC